MSARKGKRDLAPFKKEAPSTAKNASVLLVERLLKRLMDTGVTMLRDNPSEATRYFSHFFDIPLGEAERDQFVRAFLSTPPKTVLGYARSGTEMPCYAIVLQEEEEAEAFLGDYTGTEGDLEYLGADFDGTFAIYVYSMHPDVTQILYQLAKAIVHAGKGLLFHDGVIGMSISGGELAPDENYMPENMYVRVLRLRIKYPYTAPQLLPVDPAKLRVLVYACDVNVDGVPGGVHFYPFESE